MRIIALALLVTSLAGGPAFAGRDVVDAEHERLSDELEKLASRQVWTGVERKFRELERLGVELTDRDYLHGAYAARELGNVLACYQRLKAAAQKKGTKEIVDWLWDIDTNYGHVELLSVPPRATELGTAEMPFDPNQRNAVEAAIKSARADGIFVGMLPKGDYTFGGQRFSVEPGISVRIEVSPKARRQGIAEPVIIRREAPGALTVPGEAATPPLEPIEPLEIEDPPATDVGGDGTQTQGH